MDYKLLVCLFVYFPAGRDDDGVQDNLDNCPRISNPDQLDTDDDTIGKNLP